MQRSVRISGLCGLTVLWFGLSGCTQTRPTAEPVQTAARPKAAVTATTQVVRPFLWTSEIGGKQSYLFGTIHTGVDAHKELPKEVWDAFEKAPCFVMEADLQAVDMAEIYALTLQPQGKKLSDQLSPEAWTRLKDTLGDEVSEAVLQRSQPWFISLLLLREYGTNTPAMDEVFAKEARAKKKKMYVLEDWRDAVKAYAEVTGGKELEAMLMSDVAGDEETARLVAAYKSGDEKSLSTAIAESTDEPGVNDVAMERLLGARNRAWLPRLKKSTAAGGCFVAVGAGHLVGADNLRDMLSKSGYKVSRVGAQ